MKIVTFSYTCAYTETEKPKIQSAECAELYRDTHFSQGGVQIAEPDTDGIARIRYLHPSFTIRV